MEIQLESTTKVVQINGVPARLWQGVTARGVKCHALIARIACEEDSRAEEFEADLQEVAAPRPELEAIPLRLIL